ncbi:MAG: bifunctional diaminohydroxyphosphoribosylaminopyrimidine deaminase/5-amino-6-(5-phosphoribosylamino)uracil reductase RibD [Actinobacteria bacterium]|nr:bifunctional diaminohydroxyphosphoribosylaminopyrimidine deaminase/5-amino-6-(5-phosphoribosylamino)uracil reductase RibD [Actinomycetota bacterium]
MTDSATGTITSIRGVEDEPFMRRALELAERGLGLTAPNPLVGAVVVADGDIVGEGWHRGPGTPHAEAMALSEAAGRARGATLYVTLEPCAHFGRTPPCASAVVGAGIARVVAAARDPNPLVDGRGFGFLLEAGVDVRAGVLARRGTRLIDGFAKHIRTGLPFVTLKMASSLDGRSAARDGSSRWITGEEARRDVHMLRAASGAVVVGAGTAVADNPSLTVRLDGYGGRPPLRVLVDGTGRTPSSGALFDSSAPTLVATTARARPGSSESWREAGADVQVLGEERVSLARLMAHLGRDRGILTVLIEGGPTLAWSAVEEGIVDQLVLYLAAKLIGGSQAPGILGGAGVQAVDDALPVRIDEMEMLGGDLKVVGDVHRDR